MKAPPDSCCQKEDHRQVTRKLAGGLAYRCAVCGRRYLTAEFFMDEACINPISLRLWKELEAGAGDDPRTEDLARTIMDDKPYYALNLATGALNAVE